MHALQPLSVILSNQQALDFQTEDLVLLKLLQDGVSDISLVLFVAKCVR
jgi:hypothetical protein